jgi:hypothetical protein
MREGVTVERTVRPATRARVLVPGIRVGEEVVTRTRVLVPRIRAAVEASQVPRM